MFSKLTEKQKDIVRCNKPRMVVKACPGSGKTVSVSARLARFLTENTYRHSGVAVISFTRVAADEIKANLLKEYGIEIGYPHFLGTIDSFINQHIFLPFGHLIMKCPERPEIVGSEYNRWYEYDSTLTRVYNDRVVDRDPNYYFDKVSFDNENNPIPLCPASSYHFSWKPEKLYKKDGTLNQKISKIIDSKQRHFSLGKANQADANYHSLKILIEYPGVLEGLRNRYRHIMVDEAQDTTKTQMEILDLLDFSGVSNIDFIGDPDQAIFEWNTADAELFDAKCADGKFTTLHLNENRRCSQNICSLIDRMVSSSSTSISDTKDDQNVPIVIDYESEDVHRLKDQFLEKCRELGIQEEKIAVLFRGKSFGEEHFDFAKSNPNDIPWVNKKYFVRDIVQGKFLIENHKFREGLWLLEKGLLKLKNPSFQYVSKTDIRNRINELGFRGYRKELFHFINLLPEIGQQTLSEWIAQTNPILTSEGYSVLDVKRSKAKTLIGNLFLEEANIGVQYSIGTIHSVKGQTYDAVLLFLKMKAGQSNYSTLLCNLTNQSLTRAQREEIRLVYVACSRARRLLWIAVPNCDQDIWNKFLGLS